MMMMLIMMIMILLSRLVRVARVQDTPPANTCTCPLKANIKK